MPDPAAAAAHRTPSAQGVRSPRAEETRARMLEAGCKAFASKGLAGVNLKRDILDPAGVAVGSFYHQFKDKTELLLAILAENSAAARSRFREVHRPAEATTPEEITRRSYTLLFDLADQNLDAMRIQIRQRGATDERIRRFIEGERLRWRQSLAADYARIAEAYGFAFEVELAAELVSLLVDGVMQQYVALPPSERPKARARLLDGVVRLTLRGLAGLTAGASEGPEVPEGPTRPSTSASASPDLDPRPPTKGPS